MGDFNAEDIIGVLNSFGNIAGKVMTARNESAKLIHEQNLLEKSNTLKAIGDANTRAASFELEEIKNNYNAAIVDNTNIRNEIDKLDVTSADLERLTENYRTTGAQKINENLGIELNEDLTYSSVVVDNYQENLKRKRLATEKTKELNDFIRGIANNVTDLHQFVTEDPNTPIRVGTDAGVEGIIDQEDLLAFTETPYGDAIFKDKPWLKRIFLSTDKNQFLPNYTNLELTNRGLEKEIGTGRIIKTVDKEDNSLTKDEILMNENLTNDGYGFLALTETEKDADVDMEDKLNLYKTYKEVKELEAEQIENNEQLLELARQKEEDRKAIMKLQETLITTALSQSVRIDDLLKDSGISELTRLYKIRDLQFSANDLSKNAGWSEEGADKLLFNIDQIVKSYIHQQSGLFGTYTEGMKELWLKNPDFGKGKYDRGNSAGLDLFLGAPGEEGYDGIVYYNLEGKPVVNRDKLRKFFRADERDGVGKAGFGEHEAATFDAFVGSIVLYKTLQGAMIADPLFYQRTLSDVEKEQFLLLEMALEKTKINPKTGVKWTKEEIELMKKDILDGKTPSGIYGVPTTSGDTSAIMESLNQLA